MTAQKSPKTAQRGAQEGEPEPTIRTFCPKLPPEAPRVPQKAPRSPQEAPETPLEAPRWPQRGL
eukprot:4567790-Pyramimonas_sp.AAC.1